MATRDDGNLMGWRRRRPVTVTATTGTTIANTTNTTSPTSTVQPAPGPVLRGQTLGISAGSFASTSVLDACVDLGVTWVRVSHEFGWNTLDALAKTCADAHARNLKVLQVVQIAGHRYDDPTKNAGLAGFALECARRGCDAIEIGNEWNHAPFWQAPSVTIMPPVAQAVLSLQVATSLRATFPALPIITNGMSPEADPLNPWVWWPQFLDSDVTGHQRVQWDGIGLHPYVYPELATTNPVQWNPYKQVSTIIDAARARGLRANVWATEVGAPGFATNAPVVRGVALTEDRQRQCYEAYVATVHAHEQNGVRFPVTCFATMFDGQSVTTAVEQGLGLRRADGTRKPAWAVVRAFALEPLPAP